jgi:hypothetical protein
VTDPAPQRSNLTIHPTAYGTPKETILEALEDADDTEHILIVQTYRDHRPPSVAFSSQKLSELCFLEKIVRVAVHLHCIADD